MFFSRLPKFVMHCVWAGALLVALPSVSVADTYRWVDKDGVVNFADSLQKVPSEYRQSAKRIEGSSSASPKPFQVVPSAPPDNTTRSPQAEGDYQAWRDRLNGARSDLEQLKSKREQTQKEYETLRAEFYVRSFGDPEADAKYRSRIADLDNQITQKEEEINTTIPDEARRAGVPPGMLNP